MNSALYVLMAAAIPFLCALIAQGYKEPKVSLHKFADGVESVEAVERRYNRIRKLQRICIIVGCSLIVAAAATYVIPRWDNIQRNLKKSSLSSTSYHSQEAGITLAFLFL